MMIRRCLRRHRLNKIEFIFRKDVEKACYILQLAMLAQKRKAYLFQLVLVDGLAICLFPLGFSYCYCYVYISEFDIITLGLFFAGLNLNTNPISFIIFCNGFVKSKTKSIITIIKIFLLAN